MKSKITLEYLENFSHSETDYEQVIILCHGYGADAYDLRSLTEYIRPQKATRWIFPQGHLEVPIGPGWTGRAWWDIDMQALQEAMMRGETKDYRTVSPAGLPAARQALNDLIWDLELSWDQLILGGFSQGAMLSMDVALESSENAKGVIHLSGALLDEKRWKDKAAKKSGMPYFLSHGQKDQVLPHSGGMNLDQMLKANGWKGQVVSFAGAHEIPLNVCNGVQKFIDSL